jgi:hypothetical protein
MTRAAVRKLDQITVRVDSEVGKKLRGLAKAKRVSVAHVVGDTLREGVGLGPADGRPALVGNALDWLVGTLSDAEANKILETGRAHEEVDSAFWGTGTKRPGKKR